MGLKQSDVSRFSLRNLPLCKPNLRQCLISLCRPLSLSKLGNQASQDLEGLVVPLDLRKCGESQFLSQLRLSYPVSPCMILS